MIEAIDRRQDVALRDFIEVHFLGKELANQAVHILVGAALPRTIGMYKEEVGIDAAGNAFMLGELLIVVGRQYMHPMGKRRQQGDHAVGNGLRSFTRHLVNQCVTPFTTSRHEAMRVSPFFSMMRTGRCTFCLADGARRFGWATCR